MREQEFNLRVGLTLATLHRAGFTTSQQMLIVQMLVTTPEKVGVTVFEVIDNAGVTQSCAQKNLTDLVRRGFARKVVSARAYEYFPTEKLRALYRRFASGEIRGLKTEEVMG